MMQKLLSRIPLSLLVIFVVLHGQAQVQVDKPQSGKLSITSQSGRMLVLIDNVIQNETPTDSLHLKELPEGSFSIKIINTDSLSTLDKTIYINENNHEHYEHFIEGSTALLRLVGNYASPLPDSLLLPFKNDQVIKPEIIFAQFNDSSQVEIAQLFSGNYAGKTGCNFPSLLNLNRIDKKINEQPFTKRKKDVLINELLQKCIKVEDLKTLLQNIDYEDAKLNIIQQLIPYIYDVDNLSLLSELFNLQNNKETFATLIAPYD